MTHIPSRAALVASAALAIAGGPLSAQAAGLVPFQDFVSSLSATPATAMLSAAAAVKTTAAVEEMRTHLLRQYSGVVVTHSFMDSGQIFDCVPIEQQPGMRQSGLRAVASAPPVAPGTSLAHAADAASGVMVTPQPGRVDSFGNRQSCEPGSIPMQRTTLQDLSRFETLAQFFQKGPEGAGRPHAAASSIVPPLFYGHRYAHEYQYVNNFGGYGQLALYRPYVNGNATEIFSLMLLYWSSGI